MLWHVNRCNHSPGVNSSVWTQVNKLLRAKESESTNLTSIDWWAVYSDSFNVHMSIVMLKKITTYPLIYFCNGSCDTVGWCSKTVCLFTRLTKRKCQVQSFFPVLCFHEAGLVINITSSHALGCSPALPIMPDSTCTVNTTEIFECIEF